MNNTILIVTIAYIAGFVSNNLLQKKTVIEATYTDKKYRIEMIIDRNNYQKLSELITRIQKDIANIKQHIDKC